MERSRSKRYFHDQDHEYENLHPRSKPRYGSNSQGGGGGSYYSSGSHRRSASGMAGGVGGRKIADTTMMVNTSYRILCHDVKVGGVIGKSGSIIKSIRQHTGAWINVHELVPGDEERIIEISDTRRKDPDGRMPSFSPAQEALLLIHERILENEVGGYMGIGDEESEEYGGRGGGGGSGGGKVVTRLVVSRMHVGCLLGKGGKIIEQMRIETKTHIRILPRDHTIPRCIGMSEEIVQVVGDMNAVKAAMVIISSRLRESQHRDRSYFHNRSHSPDRVFPPDDDFRMNGPRRLSVGGRNFGSRYSAGSRKTNDSFRSSGFALDAGGSYATDEAPPFSEDLVFRILCPADKLGRIVGESDGILNLLQDDVGVIIDVSDPIAGSEEHIISISSDEAPDDELFPSQEALLHIQTRVVDLFPEKENIITTKLLVQSDEIASFRDIRNLCGADIEILPRDKLPDGLSGMDEILQIVGEIKCAREALMEVTSQIRSHVYQDLYEGEEPISNPSAPTDTTSSNNATPSTDKQTANSLAAVETQKNSSAAAANTENESERHEDQPTVLNRISVPVITKSTLEVVIPPHAAAELAKKSRKLTLISEISGATVKLLNDNPDAADKVIQISGTPEQTERAQSLLQGFILSTDEE